MLKVLREIMSQVYEENHNTIEEKVHKEYDQDDITLYFYQDKNKITMTALKIATQYQIDLTAKKYLKLFDKYRELGVVSYNYTDRKVTVELTKVSKHTDNKDMTLVSKHTDNKDMTLVSKHTDNKDMTPTCDKVYGYCRVSSKGQLNNNSLQEQEEVILNKYPSAKICKEQFTGITIHRPNLANLLSEMSTGNTLVVSKLDRLARNTKEGIEIIEELFDKGIAVHVLNVGLLENTTMGRFFLTTMLAVAEMERNMIIERTQAGKEIAKTKSGFKEGRPKKFKESILENALKSLTINGGSMSYKEVEQNYGISKSTLIRAQRKNKE